MEPQNPQADQLVTLTCQVDGSVNTFNYMELHYGKMRVFMYMYSPRIGELRGPWKGRHLTRKDFDLKLKRLTLSMVAERKDNGLLTCTVVTTEYPSIDVDLEASLLVRIQQKPRILAWKLIAKNRDTEKENTFLERSKIQAQCVVDLGWPEAHTQVDVKGEQFLPQQPRLSKMPSEFNYNKSTHVAFVTLSDQENGAIFTCTAKNDNGVHRRTTQVFVLYAVRDLHFPYLPNSAYEAGKVLACKARGNPVPRINITVTPLDNETRPEDFPPWSKNSSLGFGRSEKLIPKDAKPGLYLIQCIATNEVNGKIHRIGSRETKVQIKAIANAKMGLIIGLAVPACIIFLLIVFCCCKKRRRKARRKKEDVGASGGKEAQAGRGPKDSLTTSSVARPETVWSEESAFSLEPKWPLRGASSSGLGSSGLGSSFHREEELDCPLTDHNSITTLNVSPRKPPRGANNHSEKDAMIGGNHYSPEDVAATISDPSGKGFEAEEEFV